MIRIRRCACPEVLEGANSEVTAYNKKRVVKALHKMQNRKCCYCEQYIAEEGTGKAVEHYRPKSVYKKLKNEWTNLLLVCAQCNGAKSAKFPIEDRVPGVYRDAALRFGQPLMIDPSNPNIDPESHITFEVNYLEEECWGLPIAVNQSQRGRATIETVRLHDLCHVRKRRDLIEGLFRWLDVLRTAKDQKDNERLRTYSDLFELRMNKKKEFAACVRAFARFYALDKKYGVQIP